MEYIYKFIEYINESNLLSIAIFICIIVYLAYLYVKEYEQDESYLGLKLIGFYLLGGFNFTFNFDSFSLIIPIGFIIYLLFMKNKERANALIKKKATIMGLVIVCFSMLNSIIYNSIEYRDREIIKNNINIENLKNDYESIKQELNIDDSAGVDYLELEYNKNNKIRNLRYTIKDLNNKTYFISTNYNGYDINVSKTYDYEDEFFMFNSMGYNMDIETLLDVISNVNFRKYKGVSYYNIVYRNETDYHESSNNLYSVDLGNFSTEKLKSKYPIYDSINITHEPMRQVSKNSWESIKSDIYLMSYEIDEELEE